MLNIFKQIPKWNTINTPNFSIKVPGSCNCSCDFCFWNKTDHFQTSKELYFNKLKYILGKLPEQFSQISLTGGEPSISPYIKNILDIIDKNRWKKLVLTTNGTNINSIDKTLLKKVDFINISRHHTDDKINEKIYNSDTVPNTEKLYTIIENLNKIGIEVTLNCVLQEDIDIKSFISYTKRINASNICFRKVHSKNSNLDPTEQELNIQNEGYEKTSEFSCPVCVTTAYIINGMKINFKSSIPEPSDSMSNEIYETIFHEDGVLTADWKRNIEIEV
jgi:molybdenum cofactor biosynthesis enzyme MoaA